MYFRVFDLFVDSTKIERRLFVVVRIAVSDILSALDFVLVVVVVIVVVIDIVVNFDIDFDQITDLLSFEWNGVEEVALGLVDTHHYVGKTEGIFLFQLFL